jgi:hypothetical protein
MYAANIIKLLFLWVYKCVEINMMFAVKGKYRHETVVGCKHRVPAFYIEV